MKRRYITKRVPAVFLAVAIMFTTVFSVSIAVSAASFTPRLSAPDSSNKYYYNSNYNVFQKYGYGLPNCTAYAYGRAYEILGSEPKLSWNGAGQWYNYNKSGGYYKYGSTPKVGAIACWSYSGGGHVAVVEKIEGTSMTLSNSEWGGRTFYLTYAKTTDSNPGGNSWWSFQGYIYLIDSADISDEPSVSYKAGIYKTNVTTYLNMRSSANLNGSVVASIPNNSQLTVTEVKAANGYNWGYTEYRGVNGWIALEFCDYVSAIPKETAAPATTKPTTAPTTAAPVTIPEPATVEPTTAAQTATEPVTVAPTTAVPTTEAPSTVAPTTAEPTTAQPTTAPKKAGLGVGDVDADGEITVNDATMIQKYLAGIVKLDKEEISWCDFDFSGDVTINDATFLQHYLSGIFTHY